MATLDVSRESQALPSAAGCAVTHFDFRFKLFRTVNTVFKRGEGDGIPGLRFPLGAHNVFVPLTEIRKQFADEIDRDDAALLDLVSRALAHVGEIRHGDAIPSELIDGDASWRVDPAHRSKARSRLFVAMLGQVSPGYSKRLADGDLEALERDPEFCALLNARFAEIADRSGFGAANKGLVVDHVERIGSELSYIEGLRTRYGAVERICAKISGAARLYKRVRGIASEILGLPSAIERPARDDRAVFAKVDANAADLETLLRDVPGAIAFIRRNRDTLRHRLQVWDTLIDTWENEDATQRTKKLETMLREAYRFTSRGFSKEAIWTLNND